MKRTWKKHPLRLVREYIQEQKTVIGVLSRRQTWVLSASARALQGQFAHSYGLWRALYHCQEVLQLGAVQGQVGLSYGLLVQLCRALHQAALDSNSWADAGLLIPTPDPSRTPVFAGPVRQMKAAASYNKAVNELSGVRHRDAPSRNSNKKEKPAREKDKDDKGKK